jgi:hypothetical protein
MAKLKLIEGSLAGKLISGHMYFYKYVAERTNDHYDLYPLIIMLRKKGNIFEGINLHYVDFKRRQIIYDLVTPFINTAKITYNTRIVVKTLRKLINTHRKFRHAKVCLHRYDINHIKSKIIHINPKDWEKTIFKPGEVFKSGLGGKIQTTKIWKQTLILARKS